ncbi:MAG: hypothetical protein HYX78_13435, partial [Armatimonadetes bacterium]|nr:hypothetical protein [Armatimonadota bacterium]
MRILALCALVIVSVLAIQTAALAQNCSLQPSYASSVPNHTWLPDPGNPEKLNLMMHVKLCNPTGCPPAEFWGLVLLAGGSGNDALHIDRVVLFLDLDCDGVGDVQYAEGSYTVDNGVASICAPAAVTHPVINAGDCICVLVYYDMSECVPPGATFNFTLRSALTKGCEPWPTTEPLPSAVKTIGECCLQIEKHPNSPPDHTWTPSSDPTIGKVNEMLLLKLTNACCDQFNQGYILHCLKLRASGTGNDSTDIASIVLWDDVNCNGLLDTGETVWNFPPYTLDNGDVLVCPDLMVPPSSVKCLGIGYQMKPDAPCDATYRFEVIDAQVMSAPGADGCWLGTLPIRSAMKTVKCPTECCLVASYKTIVADHTWSPDPNDPNALNLMAHFQICNPDNCPPTPFGGLRLKAWGTGNDLSDIDKVLLFLDLDCDGVRDSDIPYATGKYNADDGTVTLCNSAAPAGLVLQPGQCVCVLIYYDMSDQGCLPSGATYWFSIDSALGADCKDICIDPKLRSAKKTIAECCLEIKKHPNSPPDHTWTPSSDPTVGKVNEMLLLEITNPCCDLTQNTQTLACLKLQASGTGNDTTDIASIVLWHDLN